ncbi:MAG: diheme cytochrome c [Gammaproteobacteria bacterium]|nr:diheme cytochrome c [Gammaproteobacteria bacterium]
MKKTILISSTILTACVLMVPVVFSDDDRREYRQRSVGVAAATSPAYKEECSSCHMAYPPGLLPERSWKKIMAGLETHFGDNAEIDAESFKQISEFLAKNSADKSDYRRSQKIMRSLRADDVPIRISETPYIKKEHDEIPEKLIKYNDKVKSIANCNACHSKAEQGLYDEDGVNIPGFGRWDD